jgi:three-Cys-motif partner protein
LGGKVEIVRDELGPWSINKLEIMQKYAEAYGRIINTFRLHPVYIDAFSGCGSHVDKTTGEPLEGSPLRALDVKPGFEEFHFIDIDGDKLDALRAVVGDRADVFLYNEDANEALLRIIPEVKYSEYKRALCVLDPYGLDVDWQVLVASAKQRTVEIFFNFSIMDINRNILRRDRDTVSQKQYDRMMRAWGDESWKDDLFSTSSNLFGDSEKVDNWTVAKAFRKRLHDVAGFDYVPEPVAMKNSRNTVLYFWFFASQNRTGAKIANDIFKRYTRGGG